MKTRLIYLLVCTLVLASIVHIMVILIIPKFGTRDAWTYLSGRTDMFTFSEIRQEQRNWGISEVDSFFHQGVCRFSLDDNALKMHATDTDLIWTASVFDEGGDVLYSLNNRTAIDGKLDLLIVDPLQSNRLKDVQTDEIDSSVVIEANVKQGFVVLRVFKPDESWADISNTFLRSVTCQKFSIPRSESGTNSL